MHSNTESEKQRFMPFISHLRAVLYRTALTEQAHTAARTAQGSTQEPQNEANPPRKKVSEKKPILLHLDHRTVQQMDAAAGIMNLSRTAYIRETISRNLRFFELYERKAHAKIREQARR